MLSMSGTMCLKVGLVDSRCFRKVKKQQKLAQQGVAQLAKEEAKRLKVEAAKQKAEVVATAKVAKLQAALDAASSCSGPVGGRQKQRVTHIVGDR